MDADTIRQQLRDIQIQLQRVEAERTALMTLADGFESWLRVYDPKQKSFQVALPDVEPSSAKTKAKGKPKRSSALKGTVSIRAAIREVLMAARGAHLTSVEIWNRAAAMGARTDALKPVDLVDLNLVSIRTRDPRFKKVGVRTFAFIEGSPVKSPRGVIPVTISAADSGRKSMG